jgi:hypothetical protein
VTSFAAPSPIPTAVYTPDVAIIQGNQPLVAGSPTQVGTNPRQLTITCPNFSSGVTFPLTVSLGVRVPANVGANPGVPLGADAATALSYLTLSAPSVTFTGPGSTASVTVSVNVPSPVVSGNYYWNIYVTNWPVSGVTDAGSTFNANVLPTLVSPTVKPVISNLLPVNGDRFESDGISPVSIPISYTATCVSTDFGGSSITTLQITFDSTPQTLTRNDTNITNPDGSFAAFGAVTTSTLNSGQHTITVAAVNAAGTTSASTLINIFAPPRITNTDNPAFSYRQPGSFQVTCTGYEAPTFSATGLPVWATINAATGLISASSPVVGSYPFQVTATNSKGTDSHYFTMVVSPAQVTVTANPASKVYGAADPGMFGYSISPALFAGDSFSGSLSRAAGENVGNYAISKGTLSTSSSYTVTFVSANFAITPRTLSFSCSAGNKVYDGSTATTLVVTPSGVLGSDVVVISGAATFADKNVGTAKAVAVSGLTLSGASAANYSLPGTTASTTANITKALLTVSADNKSMNFGTAFPAFTASFSGFVVGETLATSGVTGSASVTCSANTASPAGTYPITASAGTLASGNYGFTFVPGVLTITVASVQPTCGTAIVRHGPKLDGNAGVEGSLRVLLPEDTDLNGNAFISESLLVVGSPVVRIEGRGVIGLQADGTGSASPSSHRVSLNGNAMVGKFVRRTDAVAMPVVATPAASGNSRDVRLNQATESAGDCSTIRDLALSGTMPSISLPPGTYRDVSVDGKCGLKLGVVGGAAPAVYNLRKLSVSSSCSVEIVGPVIVTLSDDAAIGGTVGNAAQPGWLSLQLSAGNLKLNGTALLHGFVVAPNGDVTINGLGKLRGGLACDRLTLNGWGLVDLCGGNGSGSRNNSSGDDDDDDDDSNHEDGHGS